MNTWLRQGRLESCCGDDVLDVLDVLTEYDGIDDEEALCDGIRWRAA